MARIIPLPEYVNLPGGVYFHRSHPSDPELVLQVPDAAKQDSETYIVDLTNPTQRAWLDGLKNSRELLNLLSWAPHVAYATTTGYVQEMMDLDAIGRVPKLVADMRARQAAKTPREFFASTARLPLRSPIRRQEAQRW